jgi:uncharacterized protein (DUF2141 family)
MSEMLQPRAAIATVLAVALVMIGAAQSVQALDVSVDGLKSNRGDVVVCVWKRSDAGFPNCAGARSHKKVVVSASVAKVSIPDLAPGEYAVSMFHDEERQGKPRTNFIGMPTSALGLSNNPDVGPLNRPTFGKARISVPQTKSIVIKAKYIF